MLAAWKDGSSEADAEKEMEIELGFLHTPNIYVLFWENIYSEKA